MILHSDSDVQQRVCPISLRKKNPIELSVVNRVPINRAAVRELERVGVENFTAPFSREDVKFFKFSLNSVI